MRPLPQDALPVDGGFAFLLQDAVDLGIGARFHEGGQRCRGAVGRQRRGMRGRQHILVRKNAFACKGRQAEDACALGRWRSYDFGRPSTRHRMRNRPRFRARRARCARNVRASFRH